MTTTPSMRTVSSTRRIASTAAWSADSFSPSPTQRAAASAAASVTRTSSSARLRSGRPAALGSSVICVLWVTAGSDYPGRLARTRPYGLPQQAARTDPERADQADEPADLERDVDAVAAAGLAEHDPVEEDQRDR